LDTYKSNTSYLRKDGYQNTWENSINKKTDGDIWIGGIMV
jgi:hypothetical protein